MLFTIELSCNILIHRDIVNDQSKWAGRRERRYDNPTQEEGPDPPPLNDTSGGDGPTLQKTHTKTKFPIIILFVRGFSEQLRRINFQGVWYSNILLQTNTHYQGVVGLPKRQDVEGKSSCPNMPYALWWMWCISEQRGHWKPGSWNIADHAQLHRRCLST